MKTTFRYLVIVATLMLVVINGGALQAQTDDAMVSRSQPVMTIPIKVIGAQTLEVPLSFMHKPGKEEEGRLVEVLDLSVEVNSRDLEALPPSLQPVLHIGGQTFPVQRVEYSNWDARNEKPIDKNAPVGETQTVHFFIEDWQKVEQGLPMILSALSSEDLRKATGGVYTVENFNRIMPELKNMIPRYAPQEFIKMEQER